MCVCVAPMYWTHQLACCLETSSVKSLCNPAQILSWLIKNQIFTRKDTDIRFLPLQLQGTGSPELQQLPAHIESILQYM